MSSITYILSFSNAKSRILAFEQGSSHNRTCWFRNIAGMIQMRSIVDGVELLCASDLPVFPCFSASGRREAGSYQLPALKQGKAELLSFPPG